MATLAALALAGSLGYQAFPAGRAGVPPAPSGRRPKTSLALGIDLIGERWRPLTLSAAATALAGALYAHLVGSVETTVVFSPTFSVLPLALGMLGGALHPLGGTLGTLALYPLDELILRPALPQAHTLAYGIALVGLLLLRPEGLLRARIPGVPASTALRRTPHDPFVLAIASLTVRRNATAVLQDISLSVEPGQILRVLGPNGAGKTSLLLAIAGRIPAAEGAILFGGAPLPRGAAARARRGLARTFQTPRPFGEWTVRENVAIAAERAGALDQVDRLLEEVELTALEGPPCWPLERGRGKTSGARSGARVPTRAAAARRAPGRTFPGGRKACFRLDRTDEPPGRGSHLGRAWPDSRRAGEPAPRARRWAEAAFSGRWKSREAARRAPSS